MLGLGCVVCGHEEPWIGVVQEEDGSYTATICGHYTLHVAGDHPFRGRLLMLFLRLLEVSAEQRRSRRTRDGRTPFVRQQDLAQVLGMPQPDISRIEEYWLEARGGLTQEEQVAMVDLRTLAAETGVVARPPLKALPWMMKVERVVFGHWEEVTDGAVRCIYCGSTHVVRKSNKPRCMLGATAPIGARGRLWGGQHDCLPLGERLGVRVIGRGRLVWDGEVQWSSAPASALPGLWRWPTTLSQTRDGRLGGFFLSLHPVV